MKGCNKMDFCTPESILTGMLGDSDKEIRMLGVDKVVSIHQELSSSASLNLSGMTSVAMKSIF